jgi:hypothetical protein
MTESKSTDTYELEKTMKKLLDSESGASLVLMRLAARMLAEEKTEFSSPSIYDVVMTESVVTTNIKPFEAVIKFLQTKSIRYFVKEVVQNNARYAVVFVDDKFTTDRVFVPTAIRRGFLKAYPKATYDNLSGSSPVGNMYLIDPSTRADVLKTIDTLKRKAQTESTDDWVVLNVPKVERRRLTDYMNDKNLADLEVIRTTTHHHIYKCPLRQMPAMTAFLTSLSKEASEQAVDPYFVC